MEQVHRDLKIQVTGRRDASRHHPRAVRPVRDEQPRSDRAGRRRPPRRPARRHPRGPSRPSQLLVRRTAMTRIGVILGSTRPGRKGAQVADWVMEHARRSDATLELVDLADYPLPHLDEPQPPQMGGYHNAHTHRWAAKIASYDGFIFITPEYNH